MSHRLQNKSSRKTSFINFKQKRQQRDSVGMMNHYNQTHNPYTYTQGSENGEMLLTLKAFNSDAENDLYSTQMHQSGRRLFSGMKKQRTRIQSAKLNGRKQSQQSSKTNIKVGEIVTDGFLSGSEQFNQLLQKPFDNKNKKSQIQKRIYGKQWAAERNSTLNFIPINNNSKERSRSAENDRNPISIVNQYIGAKYEKKKKSSRFDKVSIESPSNKKRQANYTGFNSQKNPSSERSLNVAFTELQEHKIQRITTENMKLQKECGSAKREIKQLEKLMEVITNPISSDRFMEHVNKQLKPKEYIKIFKTLQAQTSVNFQLMMDYKEQINKFQSKNDELLSVIDALKRTMRFSQVQELESKVAKLKDYCQKLEQIQGAYTLPQSEKQYQSQIRDYQTILQKQDDKIQELQQTIVNTPKSRQLKSQLSNQNEKVEKLQRQLREKDAENTQLEGLMMEKESSFDEKMNEMQQKIKHFQIKLDERNQQIKAMTQEIQNLKNQNQKIEVKDEEQRNDEEIKMLKDQFEQISSQKDEQIEQLNLQIGTGIQLKQEYEDKIKELQEQLKSANPNSLTEEQRPQELENEIYLREINSKLDKKVQSYESLKQENNQLLNKIQGLDEIVAKQQKKCSENELLAQQLQERDLIMASLEEDNEKLILQNGTLKQENMKLEKVIQMQKEGENVANPSEVQKQTAEQEISRNANTLSAGQISVTDAKFGTNEIASEGKASPLIAKGFEIDLKDENLEEINHIQIPKEKPTQSLILQNSPSPILKLEDPSAYSNTTRSQKSKGLLSQSQISSAQNGSDLNTIKANLKAVLESEDPGTFTNLLGDICFYSDDDYVLTAECQNGNSNNTDSSDDVKIKELMQSISGMVMSTDNLQKLLRNLDVLDSQRLNKDWLKAFRYEDSGQQQKAGRFIKVGEVFRELLR